MTTGRAVDRHTLRTALAPLVEQLRALTTAVDSTPVRNHDIPSADSPAMREIADQASYATAAGWPTPVRDAHTFGSMTLFAASDYVRTFADTFTADKPPVYGHLVLARSALEASAVAWWLSEDGIARDERVKRGLSERLYSAVEQERLNQPGDAAAKVDEWINRANLLGWRVNERGNKLWRHGSHGQPRVDGVARPSVAESVRRLLVSNEAASIGRVLWAYLSGVSHVTWLGLEQALARDAAVPSGTPDTATVPVGTNTRSVGLQALCLLRCLRQAAGARFALMGWQDAAWHAAATAAERYEAGMIRAFPPIGAER